MAQFLTSFPPDSIICARGDYLLCPQPDGNWQVYQVEDLLLLKRLVPMLNDPAALLLEEHMLDSLTPAYFDEVFLLLTIFAPGFSTDQDAQQSLTTGALSEQIRGVLRPVSDFSRSTCRVLPGPDSGSIG